MRLYRTDSQPSKASRIFRDALRASLCAIIALGGCAKYAEQLELNPGAWAPQAVQREWAPAPGQHALVACNSDIGIALMYHEACMKGSFGWRRASAGN